MREIADVASVGSSGNCFVWLVGIDAWSVRSVNTPSYALLLEITIESMAMKLKITLDMEGKLFERRIHKY